MDTFDERREKVLREYDADLLVEMLDISAPELLDRFEDKLMQYFEENEE